MQTNPAVEQNKTLNGPLVREISPVGKEKVYGGNDWVKSQVLSSEWKTERVRKDASGDREDGKEDDDDMPCVIDDVGLQKISEGCEWCFLELVLFFWKCEQKLYSFQNKKRFRNCRSSLWTHCQFP